MERDRFLHKNHRGRMRKRFFMNGVRGMSEHEIMEMLLFFCTNGVDTNETAHRLIERFGSISGVLDADYEQLLEVRGVGEKSASFIKFFREIQSDYDLAKNNRHTAPDVDAGEFFFDYFRDNSSDVFAIADADAHELGSRVMVYPLESVDDFDRWKNNIARSVVAGEMKNVILVIHRCGNAISPSKTDLGLISFFLKKFRFMEINVFNIIVMNSKEYKDLTKYGTFSFNDTILAL